MRTTTMAMAAILALAAGFAETRPALGSVSIDATARNVSATAFCSSRFCSGDESSARSTTEIGFWNNGANAFVPVANGGAQQQTYVYPTSMGGFGEAGGSGGGSGGSWTGKATLSTTFTLDVPTGFSCVGAVAATGFGSTQGSVACAVVAKLAGSGGTVFEFDVMGDGFGGESEPIATTGTLPPGTYVFSLSAMANGFASELSFGDGSCSFDLTLSLCSDGNACAGDLDGDGVVDGGDLGQLLGGWGDGGAAGDLNCDGIIDGADVGILVAGWGNCG